MMLILMVSQPFLITCMEMRDGRERGGCSERGVPGGWGGNFVNQAFVRYKCYWDESDY